MKNFVGGIIFFILIIGCSKKEEQKTINDDLIGKWKLTERFWSPGGAGSWHPVPDQFRINFSADGKLSYTINFFGANSQFNRYSLADDTIFVLSTRNNKTDEWRYSFDGSDLIINFNVRTICFEGCASRFITVQ